MRPHTIRTWEKRYKAFSPERTDGGQRIYSEDDLIKGRLIVSLLEQGHSISRLAGKSLLDLRTLVIEEKIESSLSKQLITTVGINDKVIYKPSTKMHTNPNPSVHDIEKTSTIDALSLAANAYEARGILWWHDHAYLATPNLAAATLRDYNSFSWSGGIIKVHSVSAWPGTFQINPGNTDTALTYSGYTSPMQANKQYVLYLDRNDPKSDGTFDIRAAELTHDDDGYSRAPSFINMAYVTIGKNESAGSKTLKGNFLSLIHI